MTDALAPIVHRILLARPHAHLFEIQLSIPNPNPNGQGLNFSTWTTGSYLIREYARHIIKIEAFCNGRPVPLKKENKHTWKAEACSGILNVHYTVYAFDLSVRGGFFNSERAFIQPSALLFEVQGFENNPQHCVIELPKGATFAKKWRVATALAPLHTNKRGFGVYEAPHLRALLDAPFEIGRWKRGSFEAEGVRHTLIMSGAPERADFKRLLRDTQAICTKQIQFFGTQAPFDHYVFLLRFEPHAYGGLEHQTSTALLAPQKTCPLKGQETERVSEEYQQLLGLISHEYFHAWHVCRIRPAAFANATRTEEAYTRLLWVFEGITSYYDDLMLLRAGRIDHPTYLQCLEKTWNAVLKSAGHRIQTLEEASFDAWIKYYRQDENSLNSQVSYYTKGALVACALDLTLRLKTAGVFSLDTVMQHAWRVFGQTERAIEETEWETFVQTYTGLDLKDFFNHTLRTTEPIDLKPLLELHGIDVRSYPLPQLIDGFHLKEEPEGCKITHLLAESAAEQAGFEVGDTIIAVNKQHCMTLKEWDSFSKEKKRKVSFFRKGRLKTLSLKQKTLDTIGVQLRLKPAVSEKVLAARRAWLIGDKSTPVLT